MKFTPLRAAAFNPDSVQDLREIAKELEGCVVGEGFELGELRFEFVGLEPQVFHDRVAEHLVFKKITFSVQAADEAMTPERYRFMRLA